MESYLLSPIFRRDVSVAVHAYRGDPGAGICHLLHPQHHPTHHHDGSLQAQSPLEGSHVLYMARLRCSTYTFVYFYPTFLV